MSVSRLGPLPQLRAEVMAIDTKLTTTSMKLVEEKTLLRRKDNIKARLKDLAAYELAQQDVQALKVGHAIPVSLFSCPRSLWGDRPIPFVVALRNAVCAWNMIRLCCSRTSACRLVDYAASVSMSQMLPRCVGHPAVCSKRCHRTGGGVSLTETRKGNTATVTAQIGGASWWGTVAIAERQFKALLGLFGTRKHHG